MNFTDDDDHDGVDDVDDDDEEINFIFENLIFKGVI